MVGHSENGRLLGAVRPSVLISLAHGTWAYNLTSDVASSASGGGPPTQPWSQPDASGCTQTGLAPARPPMASESAIPLRQLYRRSAVAENNSPTP